MMLFAIVTTALAQEQIEGFWGIKLGDSETSVVSKVKQQYPNAKYEEFSTGKQFVCRKVYLAGIEVDNCYFTFTNGVFTRARFVKARGGKSMPYSQIQSYLNSIQPNVQNDYVQFCKTIESKYGTPQTFSSTVEWKTSNGNSITIKPWTLTDSMPFSEEYWVSMGIEIIYAQGTHTNDF